MRAPETRFRRNIILLLPVLILLLVSCAGTPTPVPTPTPAPLAEEISFYNWDGDEVQSVMDAFREEYGVKVNYIPFDSQEEAVENIKAGETYDVVVLEHSFFPELLQDNKLAKIDQANVPNFKHVWANFRDLNHDPGNEHSVPFTWGATFLIYRNDLVDAPITKWEDLWTVEPAGKVAFRDSTREPIGLTLKSLGYSINSEDPAQLEEALQRLLEIRDNVVFVEGSAEGAIPLMQSGEVVAMWGWAEDVELAEEEELPVTYVFPEEGLILWGDNFVIPSNSPNKETAELFLDFLMRPEINAEVVNETYYATTNEGAQPLIDEEIKENPIIFPPSENLKNAEVLLPLSPEAAELYEQIWQQFKDAGQ